MKLISYGKHSIDQSDINAVSKALKKSNNFWGFS